MAEKFHLCTRARIANRADRERIYLQLVDIAAAREAGAVVGLIDQRLHDRAAI